MHEPMVWAAWIGGLACVLLMVSIVYIDVSTRLIPRQLCWALAAAGLVFQAGSMGGRGVLVGVLAAIAVIGFCVVLDVLNGFRGGKASIGGGDVRCMVALACATGPGCMIGALACSIVALGYALPKRLMGALLPGEAFPFAPFLAVWLVVGMVACLAGG